MNFVIGTVIFLFSFSGIAKAETLDVFFGSVLRAEDVWGDVIEWQYPTGQIVKYAVKVEKKEDAATAFWYYPNGGLALRIEYTYGRIDFNQPLELVRGKTWLWDKDEGQMCFVDELEFNSRENRTLPLTMTHISSAPCSREAVYPDFWELSVQFGDKWRPIRGTLKDISSEKIIQTHIVEYDSLGNVTKEVVYNFKDYPNVENTFLYNHRGKIYKIIQKFK
ncbi:MAG: hypothetical protein HYT98_01585 [Candidatus Sungbacteria bacterium]|nr:hypothetical protein [Candidatus Sungbacteria bacterium]